VNAEFRCKTKTALSQAEISPDNSSEEDRPQGQTAISVAVDLVNLQVLVTDSKNNVITGLRPENFYSLRGQRQAGDYQTLLP